MRRPCLLPLIVLVVATATQRSWVEGAAPVGAAASPDAPVQAGSEPEYPPYCIVTRDGQADGFSVELLRAALHAVGREVVFRVGPWVGLKEDLAAGRLQVLPLVGRTPEREADYDFTVPYLTMHGAIVVRDDTTRISRPADLRGKRVAVLQGDNAEEYLHRARLGAVVVPLPSFEIALRELAAGRHDAVVMQKLLAFHLMKTVGLHNLKVVGPPLRDFTQSFCFAVRKGDTALLAALNEGLAIVMADGTFRRLYATWFADIEALGRSRSRLVVGGDDSYPPFEFLDANGQPSGFNVDLTRAIARQMGLLVQVRLGTWARIRKGLESGDVDVLQGMFYSVERDRDLSFSPPHSTINHAIVVRDGTPEPADLGGLAGKTVLVQRGDLMHELAVERRGAMQLVPVTSQEEALRRLASGEGDAALVARLPALFRIERNGWRNLKVLDRSLVSAEYCYAVPHGHEDLLAVLTEGLAAVKATGEYRKLQSRWLLPYEPSRLGLVAIARVALIGMVPLLLLLLGSFLWSRSLQRQVASRTRELTREVSERLAAQEELRHSQKMEAIALLAGGVAHNFNNILQAISAQVALVGMKMTPRDPGRVRLEKVGVEIARAARLTEQLLTFSQQQGGPPSRLDLCSAVRELAHALAPTLGPGIDLRVTCVEDALWVRIDRRRLERVVANLAANAREAMPEGGVLAITVRPGEGEPLACLEVADSGIGMDEATRQRVFEPFFSSKGLGSGNATGMGLAIVHGIVSQHEGRIEVESAPGQGSTFRVFLPLAEPEAAPAPPASS